jgi:hypothetical protein
MRSIAGISTWYPNFLRVFYSLLHSKSVKTQLLCPSKPKEERRAIAENIPIATTEYELF